MTIGGRFLVIDAILVSHGVRGAQLSAVPSSRLLTMLHRVSARNPASVCFASHQTSNRLTTLA